MSTHTPGPWTKAPFFQGDTYGPKCWGAAGVTDAEHTPWDAQRAEIMRLRTALKSYERDPLLAAAPDLLKALKALVEPPDLGDLRIEDWQNARAAIAKAEGTS